MVIVVSGLCACVAGPLPVFAGVFSGQRLLQSTCSAHKEPLLCRTRSWHKGPALNLQMPRPMCAKHRATQRPPHRATVTQRADGRRLRNVASEPRCRKDRGRVVGRQFCAQHCLGRSKHVFNSDTNIFLKKYCKLQQYLTLTDY